MLKLGSKATITKTFSDSDVVKFSMISEDKNPIHLDETFALSTQFGKRLVHGILVSGLISAVLGTKLPGPGSIYLQQNLIFKAPVFIGDTITATVEITKIRPDKPILTLETICTNQEGVEVIVGSAVLKTPHS